MRAIRSEAFSLSISVSWERGGASPVHYAPNQAPGVWPLACRHPLLYPVQELDERELGERSDDDIGSKVHVESEPVANAQRRHARGPGGE